MLKMLINESPLCGRGHAVGQPRWYSLGDGREPEAKGAKIIKSETNRDL